MQSIVFYYCEDMEIVVLGRCATSSLRRRELLLMMSMILTSLLLGGAWHYKK